MIADLRHATRTLRRSPAYTVTVVATLALGLGAATAAGSVLRSVLLQRSPTRRRTA
ncbi:MAG: hypothetical protein H0T68_05580 [Gemmatimonadales bacterium]|nr:hypothetical protein [Gemmatimonadales bacterium]MBA3553386.1 hypothetical protein [Gemmatimonadales bacterium]